MMFRDFAWALGGTGDGRPVTGRERPGPARDGIRQEVGAPALAEAAVASTGCGTGAVTNPVPRMSWFRRSVVFTNHRRGSCSRAIEKALIVLCLWTCDRKDGPYGAAGHRTLRERVAATSEPLYSLDACNATASCRSAQPKAVRAGAAAIPAPALSRPIGGLGVDVFPSYCFDTSPRFDGDGTPCPALPDMRCPRFPPDRSH
jgi:hypothetical protein